jgi:hypothetical protein
MGTKKPLTRALAVGAAAVSTGAPVVLSPSPASAGPADCPWENQCYWTGTNASGTKYPFPDADIDTGTHEGISSAYNRNRNQVRACAYILAGWSDLTISLDPGSQGHAGEYKADVGNRTVSSVKWVGGTCPD